MCHLNYFIFLQLSHHGCLIQRKVKYSMACWHKIRCGMVGSRYGIIEAILTTDISLIQEEQLSVTGERMCTKDW